MKKALSLALALAMCLGLLPVTTLADESGGDDDGGGFAHIVTDTIDEDPNAAPETITYSVTIATEVGEPEINYYKAVYVDGAYRIQNPPADPVREGYVFKGWYDRTGDGRIPIYDLETYDITRNTVIISEWEKIEYTITFEPRGGTVTPEKATTNSEGKLSIPLPKPVRDGYIFNGWYSFSSSDPVTEDTVYTRNLTLTADWIVIETAPYRIDFHPNGGRITELEGTAIPQLTSGQPPFYVDQNGNTGVDSNSGRAWTRTDANGRLTSLPTAERSGYVFDGWRYSLTGANTSAITTQTVFDAGTTVYAAWKAASDNVTVTFKSNTMGKYDDPKPLTLKKGEEIELPDTPKWEGYMFLGWYSGNLVKNELKNPVEWEDGDKVTEDITLYALWKEVGPVQPAKPVIEVEKIPASGTAVASTQTVTVDGKAVEFQMYALKDANGNLTNYIKLRDMAYVLNGTQAQFSVGYDGSIFLTTGKAYVVGGTEMTTPFSGDRAYKGGAQSVRIDGSAVDMTAITLTDDNGGGYNYFKLRDLGMALGFNVKWDNGVVVESDKPYTG